MASKQGPGRNWRGYPDKISAAAAVVVEQPNAYRFARTYGPILLLKTSQMACINSLSGYSHYDNYFFLLEKYFRNNSVSLFD